MYLCVCVMFVASCLLTPWQDCFNLVYECFKFETVLSVGLKLGYTLNPRVCHIGHVFIKWQSWGCTVYPIFRHAATYHILLVVYPILSPKCHLISYNLLTTCFPPMLVDFINYTSVVFDYPSSIHPLSDHYPSIFHQLYIHYPSLSIHYPSLSHHYPSSIPYFDWFASPLSCDLFNGSPLRYNANPPGSAWLRWQRSPCGDYSHGRCLDHRSQETSSALTVTDFEIDLDMCNQICRCSFLDL